MDNAKRDRLLIFVSIGLAVLLIFTFFRFLWMDQWIQGRVQNITTNQNTMDYAANITVIVQSFESEYWKKLKSGIQESAKLYKFAVKYIELEKIPNSSLIEQMDLYISANTDAILVQPVNSQEFHHVLKRAKNEMVPVVFVDAELSTTNRTGYVGINQYESAQLVGERILSENQRIDLAIIHQSAKDLNHSIRLKGLRDTFGARKRAYHLHSNVQTSASIWDAERAAEQILKEKPQVNVMIGFGEQDAVGIVRAVEKQRRKDVKIYAFDHHSQTIEAIRLKKINAGLILLPYQIGFDSIRIAANYLSSLKIQDPTYLNIELLTPENASNQEVNAQ